MKPVIDLNAVCEKSPDVIAREIEDEILIVPLVAGIGDADDELYTLNETGQAIWQALDGRRTLNEVAALLAEEFDAPLDEVNTDVLGFTVELTGRGILVAKS
ncbi:MAG: PqqD family protein [Proteobacteria bacterium]|nr:PqqD family protein [Pseudomonadota bacterium]